MAANANTDLTEEDAADLQFPKGYNTMSMSRSLMCVDSDSECTHCLGELPETYIFCVECQFNLCCECFARGAEFGPHKNNHSYRVFNSDFVLFEHSGWSAREELNLLNGLLKFGSFEIVANRLNKPVKEVLDHYDYYYLQRHGSALLPVIKETRASVFPEEVIPFRYKVYDVSEPTRYAPHSQYHNNLAGYNAARSDFDTDYDNNSEFLISELQLSPHQADSRSSVLSELMAGIVRCYNLRLAERRRRHAIVKEHGLIMLNKLASWLHRYDVTITHAVCDRLVRFMQFYTAEEFEKFMEGLHRVGELKLQIARLCELHRKGITSLPSAQLYLNLRQHEDTATKDLKLYRGDPHLTVRHTLPHTFTHNATFNKERNYRPLDIVGMPSYEKLLVSERDLCERARLVPTSYLELKDLLIRHNNKMGFLKLCTARKMLKIDVNKTRKLYDFLIKEGFISKGSESLSAK